MTLKIEFETDNAAFDDNRVAETGRILHEIADQVADGWKAATIHDINGNRIEVYDRGGIMYPHLSDFEKAAVIEAEMEARTKQKRRRTIWRSLGDLAGSLRPLLFMMRPAAKKEANA